MCVFCFLSESGFCSASADLTSVDLASATLTSADLTSADLSSVFLISVFCSLYSVCFCGFWRRTASLGVASCCAALRGVAWRCAFARDFLERSVEVVYWRLSQLVSRFSGVIMAFS
ncbi:MAG: pentapeptide repeat-containing protein [Alphaproteobacteria bacterium]